MAAKRYAKYPTQELVKECLTYDPLTGHFTRKKYTGGRGYVGEKAGAPHNKGYWRISVGGGYRLAHVLAWIYMKGSIPNKEIDHINGNGADNRWENLREATHAQNGANRPKQKNNSTGFKGVSVRKNRPKAYYARIKVNNRKTEFLGCFQTPHEAHAAYEKRANELLGEFARAA